MSEAIQSTLQVHPWAGLLLVALMAWLEYVFPPVPGDTTMLFACFLAGTGVLPLPAVIAACLGGSIAGAMTAWSLGARLGRSYFFLRSSWALAELTRLERAFDRFGARLLLVNRFIPGLRGVFLYGAGIARLRWSAVLVHSSISNLLWVALIAWGGASLGSSWEEVRQVFRRYAIVIGVGLTIYLAASILRGRRRRRAEAAGVSPASS